MEPPADLPVLHWLADLGLEHQVELLLPHVSRELAFCLLALPMLLQGRDRSGSQVDGPPALCRLRLHEHEADALLPLQRPPDRQLAHFEIEVLPLEPESLAQPQAGGCQQDPQSMKAVIFGHLEQAPCLLDAQRPNLVMAS